MAGSKVDLKVVLLGMHDVGKTCLVERYLQGKFDEGVSATVGAAFGARKIEVDGKSITMGIWDTAGSERYESMSRIYYRSARAAAVCYDLTNKDSFEKVKFWVDELLNNEENCIIYIVGTKVDLLQENGGPISRPLPQKEVNAYAQSIKATIFETSAKNNTNVEELFNKIASDFLKKKCSQRWRPTKIA